ncbi:XP-G family nuclease [Schizosaccharomyces japonicus yFS275]|uniref:XP-G family nuclease n=1 Tax=Schizosaccharomyces japonicus (strain yFS275 / FY16936) TaxID=402676 RepID=B6JZY4_SCHJY|nr:XP-G family nuclease [Schizosaccharomyces japonicus yFS275]EEB06134.1 XP-G family nuclease [Schizosaccharomyces japonicus yFS275]
MGVNGLLPFIRKFAGHSIEYCAPNSFHSVIPKVAIDGTLFLHKEYRSPQVSNTGKSKHLYWALKLARYCRKTHVSPIVVFDSASRSVLKRKEHARRKQQKERNVSLLNKINASITDQKSLLRSTEYASPQEEQTRIADQLLPLNLEDELEGSQSVLTNALNLLGETKDEITQASFQSSSAFLTDTLQRTVELREKVERRLARPSINEVKETAALLNFLNIPVSFSPENVEGETLAASLYHSGLASAVCTQDTDALLLGTLMIYDFFNISKKFELMPAQFISSLRVQKNLGLTYPQFFDYCLLCGTDFCERINQIGPVRALKLIRQFGSLDAILKYALNDPILSKILPQDYNEDLNIARSVFSNIPNDRDLLSFASKANSFSEISESTFRNIEEGALRTFQLHKDVLDMNSPWYNDSIPLDFFILED